MPNELQNLMPILLEAQQLKQREYEFKNSELMTSSQYMRSRIERSGGKDCE